jgi:HK97 family phage major capsid protein
MSAFMADVATNSYSVLFGDLRGFYMVDRVGFSVRVLSELYAETNQVLLLGRIRFGGQVAEPWRMKIGKTSA